VSRNSLNIFCHSNINCQSFLTYNFTKTIFQLIKIKKSSFSVCLESSLKSNLVNLFTLHNHITFRCNTLSFTIFVKLKIKSMLNHSSKTIIIILWCYNFVTKNNKNNCECLHNLPQMSN